jgi:transposase
LAEYGIIIPQGIGHIAKRLPDILENGENGLPGAFRQLLHRLGGHRKELDRQVGEREVRIQVWHRENEASKKLAQIPGIGPITASALVASIVEAKSFENGRPLVAWRGLVPNQHSSGGKQWLLGISKHGDTYLRTRLIHGARAVIRVAERKASYAQSGLAQLISRRNKNVAAVALANKNARIVWALLAHERDYQPGDEPSAA